MERQVHIFSHSDWDGILSAAIVKERYPYAQVTLTNYGKSRNLYRVKPGDIVFVTDFTLTFDEFQRLKQKGAEIHWIDHHKANYDLLYAQGWQCPGIRRDDYCGAALTWMYLHPNVPIEAMPDIVKLCNDYDLWLFKDPRTKDFAQGMGLWDTRPGVKTGDDFWAAMLSKDDTKLKLVLKFGAHIRNYVEMMQDTYCADCAYYTAIATPMGQKNILALTIRAGNSSVFDRMDKSKVDAVFTGQYVANIGHYRCSMYSPDNIKPILPIVQMFGGGGHPNAAGFQSDKYPLPLPELKDPVPLEEALEPYKNLYNTRQRSCILQQWWDRSCSITLRAEGFHTEFLNFPVLAVNHQFLPDVVHVASTAINIINQETSVPAKYFLGWVVVNTGWTRCCVYPTDTSVSTDEILDALKQVNPEAAKTAITDFGGLWWYQKGIPVRPPIFAPSPTQQARM